MQEKNNSRREMTQFSSCGRANFMKLYWGWWQPGMGFAQLAIHFQTHRNIPKLVSQIQQYIMVCTPRNSPCTNSVHLEILQWHSHCKYRCYIPIIFYIWMVLLPISFYIIEHFSYHIICSFEYIYVFIICLYNHL